MTKKKNKKKVIKLKKKIVDFLKSSKAIILALIILVVILLCLCNHLMKSTKVYMFSGKNDNVLILNGVISLNYNMSLLQGSDITYIGEEDYKITEYKIGYYVTVDNTLVPLVVNTRKEEEALSLKGILNETSAYNITEPYYNDMFFTKEKIKALDEGMYFIIEAKTSSGEEILEKIELSLSKVSK